MATAKQLAALKKARAAKKKKAAKKTVKKTVKKKSAAKRVTKAAYLLYANRGRKKYYFTGKALDDRIEKAHVFANSEAADGAKLMAKALGVTLHREKK